MEAFRAGLVRLLDIDTFEADGDLRHRGFTLVKGVHDGLVDAVATFTRVKPPSLRASFSALHQREAHTSFSVPDKATFTLFSLGADFFAIVIAGVLILRWWQDVVSMG